MRDRIARVSARGTSIGGLGRDLAIGERTLVMGVVNATDDSFSGDGLGDDVGAIRALGERMVAEGADALDVGAASSRPGHGDVPPDLERRRATRAVEALADVGVPLSIDSTRAEVVEACLRSGARVVNDVSCLADARLATLAADHDAWLVIAHGVPVARPDAPPDMDPEAIVDAVAADLREASDRAVRAGVPTERIVVDPGLGFHKTPAESFALLRGLSRIRAVAPVLVGSSRKRHLGVVTGRAVGDRAVATAAAAACAVMNGADLVRVHDVRETVDAVRVADAVRRGRVRRTAYVGLGANVGPRRATLARAVAALARLGRVRAVSGLWETAPREREDQPSFLNAVAAVEIDARPAAAVVADLKRVEAELGREPSERYGPRAIDLDLLLFAGADAVERDGDVTVPHERLAERRFVLAPLAELAPDEVDPRTGGRIRDLLAAVAYQAAQRVAGGDWWTTASS